MDARCPGEVAHAARAIVRGLLLAMMDQPEVRRVRAQWDCDGENLLINVRDDGGGTLAGRRIQYGQAGPAGSGLGREDAGRDHGRAGGPMSP